MGLQTVQDNCVRSRCNWETYERLLEENASSSAPRFTYDRGWLEIMSPSIDHEKITEKLRNLVQALADRVGLDYEPTGSTTFRREDLQRGFEPDASYYFQQAALIRSIERLDLSKHPGPELVIEVEVHHSDLDKLALYHALGVQEVWRWSKGQLLILIRGAEGFLQQPAGSYFPEARAEDLARLVLEGLQLTRPEWNRILRAWLDSL